MINIPKKNKPLVTGISLQRESRTTNSLFN